jgi:hypothetical protein
MKRRTRRTSSLFASKAKLAAASGETIFRRSLMMAKGTCSPAEYQRMVSEKVAAMQASTLAMMTGRGPSAIIKPYLARAGVNAKRLRHKS